MAASLHEPTSKLFLPAVLSLLLGLAALVPYFLIVAGLPALLVGFVSLRFIHQSEGRLHGTPWAILGMILGGLGSLVSASGFLLGLVLESREKANRLSCQNQLRIIGQATNHYHDKYNSYPPATLPLAGWPPEQRWSWLAGIRPFLHADEKNYTRNDSGLDWTKQDTAQPWTASINQPFVNVTFSEYFCPSCTIRSAQGSPALTHYVGFSGIGPDAAQLPAEDRRAGFFGFDRTLTDKQLALQRGTSRTAMVTETAWENGPWAAGGLPTVRELDPAQRPYLGPGKILGGIHRTGLYVLFADGSTNYFLNAFQPDKLETLVTIHGE